MVLILTVSVMRPMNVWSQTHTELENLELIRYDGETFLIKTIHYQYGNNRFLSLRDVAYAFAGTDKHFELKVDPDKAYIITGMDYVPAGGECVEFESEEYSTESLRMNPISIDDRECRYYSFAGKNPEGARDLFINITDLAMALDANLKLDSESGRLMLEDGSFTIDIDEYIKQGLFDEVSSAIVGDAQTGEIFVSFNEDVSVSCASTTKLMTYLCVMDAVSRGEVSLDDTVTISAAAAKLSWTEDGEIHMSEGQSAKLWELLYALLLLSSNEAALAMAEYLDGSEESFVKRMNNKADELFLSDATYFYNCHGLPEFSDTVAASKIQNHVSAHDMFILASHIVNKYPEIKEITSTKKYKIASFDAEVKNTNHLLYNLPGTVGLKTGTTNASGSSLVAAYDIETENGTKTVIAVQYGAEDSASRNTVTEILLRYGIQCDRISDFTAGEEDFPYTAEELIKRLIRIKSANR